MKPVIDDTTSILGYPANLAWEYQPAATNSPDKWTCTGLPAGMSIDAATGLISGTATTAGIYVCPLIAEASVASPAIDATANTIGLTAHGLANGDRVYLTSAGGSVPAGLTSGTIYFVVNTAADTFKVAATLGGSAIDITGVGSGTITVHELSDTVNITIGIDSAPSDSMATLLVDVNTSRVYQSDGEGGWTALFGADGKPIPALWMKHGDAFPLAVRFCMGAQYVDLPLTSLKLTFKQFEPEAVLFSAGGDDETGFLRVAGSSAELTYYVVVIEPTGDALDNALSEAEADAGTAFWALAEIEWQLANPYGIGPDTLIRTSLTFIVGLERDLTANS